MPPPAPPVPEPTVNDTTDHATLLALDTVSPSAAVAVGGRAGITSTPLDARRAAADLVDTIDATLHRAGVRRADLRGVLCTAGPGSFTGIRIGMATVLGLTEALALPGTAVSCHAIQAWIAAHDAVTADVLSAGPPLERILSFLPSHRGLVSVQEYSAGAPPRALGPLRHPSETELAPAPTLLAVCSAADLRDRLRDAGWRTVDPGDLAVGLLRMGLAGPPSRSGVSPALWDDESLVRPVYGHGPAVSTPPRAVPGAATGETR